MKQTLIIAAAALALIGCSNKTAGAADTAAAAPQTETAAVADTPAVAEQQPEAATPTNEQLLNELAQTLLNPKLTVSNGLLDYFTPKLQAEAKKPLSLEEQENGWEKFKSIHIPITPQWYSTGPLKLKSLNTDMLTITYTMPVEGEYDMGPSNATITVACVRTGDKLLINHISLYIQATNENYNQVTGGL